MRMEAKNNFVKQITKHGNFKNLSLSVTVLLLCVYLNSKDIFDKCVNIYVEICPYKCMNYNFNIGFVFVCLVSPTFNLV